MATQPNPQDPADARSSQVSVVSRFAADTPVTRPFIIYSDTDITGTATGSPNVESYCALASTSASRYRLNRADHNQIFAFTLTAQGTTRPAYCLDKFRDGPYGDVPYQSAPFETLFPDATARQKAMLAWLLANAYPIVSASDTFALAGVNSTEAPVLDNNDAYAAVQVAIWVLLGQIAPDEVEFLNCSGDGLHPKSPRLRAAVFNLLARAGAFADAPAAPQQTAGSACCRCCSSNIQCCSQPSPSTNANDPFLRFTGCPDEVRSLCGRLLVGPFMLNANLTGAIRITVEPICDCSGSFSAHFTDFCGNPLSAPQIGQEFYLAIRATGFCVCFHLNVSLTGTITRVLTMGPTSTALNYQPIGSALEDYEITRSTSLCVCISLGAADGGACSGSSGTGIYIQNNNNNNNNNNSSSTSSSSNSSAGGTVILPPGIGFLPFWCCPPWACDPAQPPYPPRPPYPPEPPYPPRPPRPPYPPEPPYPPRPPRPPYPPEPPYPPRPPYPPEPPCPPPPCCGCDSCRPPKPDCPPCRPEPPCPPPPCCGCDSCRPPKPDCPPCKPDPCRIVMDPCNPDPCWLPGGQRMTMSFPTIPQDENAHG